MKCLAVLFSVLLLCSGAASAHPLDCPGPNGTLPTPTYGSEGAVFTACASNVIKACPSTVYDILTDFKNYHIWNTFVIAVQPLSFPFPAVGATMEFTTVGLEPGKTVSNESITVLDPGKIAAWKSDGEVVAEHPSVLIEIGVGVTKYVSWETYYGPTGTLLLPLRTQLQTQFVVEGNDLKAYAESLSK